MAAVSPSSFLTVHASNSHIQVLSVVKIAAGLGFFVTPAFFSQKFFGFTQRTTSGAQGSVATTTPKPGSPEELTLALRLFAAREFALGLLLRDSSSVVVERALQISYITDAIDIVAAAVGYIEGTLSKEVAGTVAGIGATVGAYALWILNR